MGVIAASRRRAGAAAVGAVASLSDVHANGWTATWNGTPPTFVPDGGAASQHYVSVVRQGFDANGAATSYIDRHVVTARVREPYPDQAVLTPADVALSDYVYATDAISGVTNNSLETSPNPVANWVMPARQVVGDEVTLEIVAFHRDGVACVEFSVSDGASTVTQKVSTTVVSNRPGDRHAVVVYRATLDVSTLADKVLLTANARIYPRIGATDSIADSSTSVDKRGFSPRHFMRDVALAASPPVAYVAKAADGANGIGVPSNGGVVSTSLATAKAAPFDTVQNALAGIQSARGANGVDGCIIMIGDDGGTPHVMASSVVAKTQKCGALTITRDPNVAQASARVSFGAAAFRPMLSSGLLAGVGEGALRFSDIHLVRTGLLTFTGEAAANLQVHFDNGCTFDNGGNNATFLNNSHDYHCGTTLTNANGSAIIHAGNQEHRMWRGLSWQPSTVSNGNGMEGWLVVGCALKNALLQRGTRGRSGAIIAFSEVLDMPSTGQLLAIASDEDVEGFAYVQNLHEWLGTNQNNALAVSADGATGDNSHVIVWNNSYAGAFLAGRWNVFYDEGATARTSRLMSVKGNIAVQINTKSDVFRGVNQAGADATTRTGSWAFLYGVGCQGNFSQYVDAARTGLGSSFAQAYPGLGCSIGTSDDTATKNDAKFVSDQAVTVSGGGTVFTAGAGGGDYHLQADSPCRGMVAAQLLAFDLDGNARAASSDSAGAYA